MSEINASSSAAAFSSSPFCWPRVLRTPSPFRPPPPSQLPPCTHGLQPAPPPHPRHVAAPLGHRRRLRRPPPCICDAPLRPPASLSVDQSSSRWPSPVR